MGTACFSSGEELREVLDRVLREIDADPEDGPKLGATRVHQRIEVTDLGFVVNVAAEEAQEHCLRWTFGPDAEWEPELVLSMDSEVANSWFQGRENVPIALARRRIKASGDAKAALRLLPAAGAIFARFRDLVEREYPHLALR